MDLLDASPPSRCDSAGVPATRVLDAFELVAARWALSPSQRLALLGAPDLQSYARCRRACDARRLDARRLPIATRTRLVHVFRIYRALQRRFDGSPLALSFVRTPDVDGHAPIERMIEPGVDGLVAVRYRLESESIHRPRASTPARSARPAPDRPLAAHPPALA